MTAARDALRSLLAHLEDDTAGYAEPCACFPEGVPAQLLEVLAQAREALVAEDADAASVRRSTLEEAAKIADRLTDADAIAAAIRAL